MKTTVRRDGPQEPPKPRYSPFDSEVLLQNFAAQNDRSTSRHCHPWVTMPIQRRKDRRQSFTDGKSLQGAACFVLYVTWQPKYSATILSYLDEV
ncbi:hypothetical protein GCG54_00006677 [Colletotrichum gloeosporioides]|uniref:Uncharacterized protein n=1 Tax=Colletotrichum gloeosporioides TaxID=474922 RepID=A0A8H4FRR7_COLGL|nr:uncharacterized protein GCG54_00006677 [Colletotrichum gloeosporioides]KAF3810769.1 hypothetical protein GCG54_00006677 [Colletotrichum gloeosporioides]